MNLLDIVSRNSSPRPWAEGDNIPWNDPEFSARMLNEHLSQDHDAASRRSEAIDKHVEFIHHTILHRRKSSILDLGCGPGLYSTRLAQLGHTCLGIDFSPASIEYARQLAQQQALPCSFILEDIRRANYGSGHNLAMLIYGEINVFSRENAALILKNAWNSLDEGGVLLLEPHTFELIRNTGQGGRNWYTEESGLFSDQPHLVFVENFWDEGSGTVTTRYHVVDAATGKVTRHAQSFQAYTDDQYRDLLQECGYVDIRFYPALTGVATEPPTGFFALTGRKDC